jgi:sporulation protein YlmC with PRC-barrel domain
MVSRRLQIAAVAAGLLLSPGVWALTAHAQENKTDLSTNTQRQMDDRNKPAAEKGLHPGLIRLSKMNGEDVYNTQGEKIGDIKDFMLDTHADRIAFAVMSTDRNLGLDGKYLAVPWKDFSFNRSQDHLVLKLDKDRLSGAPAFESSKWPDAEDHAFWQKASTYYGGSLAADTSLIRASEFMKMNAKNSQDKKLGSIQDVVLDSRTGRVRYAVLGEGGFLGLGGKYFAIPMTAFRFPSSKDDKDLMLDADKDRLAKAPGFDKNHWPDMASTQWSNRSDKYWGNRNLSKQG